MLELITLTYLSMTHSRSDHAYLAMCVPKDAQFTMIFAKSGTKAKAEEASSLDDVYNDSEGGKYFFDSSVG